MVYLYSDDDLWDAYRQRRNILAVFFSVCAAYLAILIGFIIYYVSLPYGDGNITWVKWTVCIISVLFVFFSCPFMGIKFKRSNAYYRMLKFITVGMKECMVAPFVGIEDWTTRDYVDVNVASFTVRGVKRNEEMVRHIYIDGEKDYPPFYEGDVVKVISQGNLLIAYEIVKKAEPSAQNIPTEQSAENDITKGE